MVHYEHRGHGPAIICIAGLGGLGGSWHPVMDRLQAGHTVVTFDHPGVGKSASRAPQSIEGIVGAVLDVAAELGLDRYTVVGHSTGGLVAQALALDHPGAVEKLVLSCTWAAPDRHFLDLFHLRRRVLTEAGMAAYKTHGNLLAYPPDFYERYARAVPETGKDQDDPAAVALVAARIDMLTTYSRQHELGRITAPTLVIGAPDDQIAPIHHSRQLAGLVPGAELATLEGGHFIYQTRTDEYAQRLLGFLQAR